MCVHACMLSCFSPVQLFVNLWNVVCKAPLSIGYSSQEFWSGLPCHPPGDLPDPENKLHLWHLLHCRQILSPLNYLYTLD